MSEHTAAKLLKMSGRYLRTSSINSIHREF